MTNQASFLEKGMVPILVENLEGSIFKDLINEK